MKASEVPIRNRAETLNFQGKNLRGKSFKGQDLSRADFSEADLRGTNFTGTNLRGAKFVGAKCGLQKRWVVLLTLLSWLMAAVSGFFSIFFGTVVSFIFDSRLNNQTSIWSSLLVLFVFLIVTIHKGIASGAITLAGTVIFGAAWAAWIAGISVAGLAEISVAEVAGAIVIGTAVAAGATWSAVLFAVIFGATWAVAAVATWSVAAVGTTWAVAAVATWSAVTVAEVAAAAVGTTWEAIEVIVRTVIVGAAWAIAIGTYIGWRAMKEDPKDAWIRSFGIAFATLGGTNFRGADLTGANFSSARLKSTDMRQANLTRVRWFGANMIDRVRPGDTYLQSTQVRQWLIGQGVDKNFDRQDLRGINLDGADLTDASFIGADLSKADLQSADLSKTKLVQTQLDNTDLTGTTLTGAIIEDWGITTHTKLDNVKCEYVYMRLPTPENLEPCRKPDNRQEVFADGDFADFIKPIYDTLDLYHNQGVDPRAIAISWKKLAENNPDANLRFASMEVKGEDNLLLRLKASHNADLSKLSAEYSETYNQLKALAEEDSRKLIAEKDRHIRKLESFVATALERPSLHAEQYHHQGDIEMAGEQRKIEISGGTVNASGAGAFSLGNISGTVANTINQLPSSSNSDEPGIKELLTQLQTVAEDPQLSEDDKKQVLNQVQVLAEAGQNPQDETMQKKAERAVGFLEVIAKGVEPASKLAKASAKVLPKIIAFFA